MKRESLKGSGWGFCLVSCWFYAGDKVFIHSYGRRWDDVCRNVLLVSLLLRLVCKLVSACLERHVACIVRGNIFGLHTLKAIAMDERNKQAILICRLVVCHHLKNMGVGLGSM